MWCVNSHTCRWWGVAGGLGEPDPGADDHDPQRGCWRSPTGTASPPSRGPGCCAMPGAAACAPQCWRSGTGGAGFWAALREVFPETAEQRCWQHKVVNVLDCLPRSAQGAARKVLAQIRDAEDREHAEKAIKDFAAATAPSTPRPSRRSPRTRRNCSPSSASLPSTGSTSRRPTRSSRPSPRSGCGRRSPRAGQPRRRAGHGVQAH
jgi:hypothetical protein